MTRNDFELIARTMASVRPSPGALAMHAQWLSDVEALATMCKHINARFNKDRFIEACMA